MRWKFAAPVFVFLVLIVSISAVSASRDTRRERLQERIETLTMWKMMEALDLDKATADKVFAIRRKYLRERSKLQEAVRKDIDRLRYLLRESRQVPGDDELSGLINSILENRKKLRELWEKQYIDVSKVLSVRQQAELVLFLKDFRRELQQILGRGRPGGPGEFRGERGRRPFGPHGPVGPGMHPPPPPPPHHGQPRRQPADPPWGDSGGAPDEPLDEP